MRFEIDKKDATGRVCGTIATFDNLDVAIGLYINLLEEDADCSCNNTYNLDMVYYSEIIEDLDVDTLYSINSLEYGKLTSKEKTKIICEIMEGVKNDNE